MKIDQLHQLFLQCEKVNTDTRKIEQNSMFFALKGSNFNGNVFANQALKNGAKYAIIDEEEYQTSNATILVEDVLLTLQQLATYHRDYLKIPILSLTGSNGKTTTKELINTVLSKKFKTVSTFGNLNNHIGVPLTLLSMNKETEIGIVEMGANHIKEIEFLCHIAKPDYGYITNFGKAHLEGFGSIEGVIKGKTELYDYLIKNDKHIFFNADDDIQVNKLSPYINKTGFSQLKSDYYTIKLIDAKPFVKIKIEDLIITSNLIGKYNFTNLCAAVLIGKYFNIDPKEIKEGIESYLPKNNRSQIINKGNNKIILDAYNANPTSMEAALTNFANLNDKNKMVILGDMFELGNESEKEHQIISQLVKNLGLETAYLVGENFHKTKSNSNFVKTFKSFEDFKSDFKSPSHTTILIKGSRGMALERILECI
ncbi:UDP-N-acetylmuramoyl-tripeptide--D-alanyl-D-alanine ligase [Lacinutrix iliipiscaria]|uniref:UDP-N-acetylmuramoyl-tripeptide--D-alanyl-D-alanine ligase n=1 Tax=Lacinutrix iliipiscaria TaxID=1230532 RepID=A0ABW5WRA1_9FLAO